MQNKTFICIWLMMLCINKTITMGHKLNSKQLNDNAKRAVAFYNETKNHKYNDHNDNDYVNYVNKKSNVTAKHLQEIRLVDFNFKDTIENLWTYFSDYVINDITTTNVQGSRTFGKIRRLQQILIPLAFKFGILFSMVTFLLLVGLKTLFLLKALILLNVVAVLSKFFTLKSSTDDQYSHISYGHYGGGGGGSWTPHYLPEYPHIGKEVHIHIHGNGSGGGGGSSGDNFVSSSSHLSNFLPSYYSSPNGWNHKSESLTKTIQNSIE